MNRSTAHPKPTIFEPWHTWLQNDSPLDSREIYSLVIPIAPVDSLDVLHRIDSILARPIKHFFWENRLQGRVFINFGTIQEQALNGEHRFTIAQKFVQTWQPRIFRDGNVDIPTFFCSFPFFPESNPAAPFAQGMIMIPRLQIIQANEQFFLVLNGDRQKQQELRHQAQAIEHFLAGLPQKLPWGATSLNLEAEANQSTAIEFVEAVKRTLQLIDQGKLSKIVLAHIQDISAQPGFNVVRILDNLRSAHPDCCIFSLRNTQGDTFLGASPERLLRIQQDKLSTDALAGSAPRGDSQAKDQHLAQGLINSAKEKREHQAVVDFLFHQLQQLGLSPQIAARKLLRLSNIQHLWTPITAILPGDIHPLEVVSKLHPTPAVAGVPRAIACEQIRQLENFERALYAAPIGWLDTQGNSEFIVAIRSALIQGQQARLYAGAGIVSGSEPEREYAEVTLKFTSLLEALA